MSPPEWADVATGVAVGMAGGALVGWLVGLLHGAELEDDEEEDEVAITRHELGVEVQRLQRRNADEKAALYREYGAGTVPPGVWAAYEGRRTERQQEIARLQHQIARLKAEDQADRDASGRQPLYAAAPVLLEVLESIEHTDGRCPSCGASQSGPVSGHVRGCALRSALDLARG